MIAYVSNTELGDSDALTSYTVPKLACCSEGDLILMMVGTSEQSRLDGATIKTDGDIAAFTDLFLDGYYSPPDAAHQYVLDDGVPESPRLFWWAGWKIADSNDADEGSYTVNVASAGDIGAARCKVDIVSYSGATGIAEFASQYFALSGFAGSTVTCPAVPSHPADFTMHMAAGAAPYQGGFTVTLDPVSSPAWIVCGAIVFYADGLIEPDSPLVTQEQSLMDSVVRDAGAWAQATGGSGLPGLYLDPQTIG